MIVRRYENGDETIEFWVTEENSIAFKVTDGITSAQIELEDYDDVADLHKSLFEFLKKIEPKGNGN
jgi:hypothetical protein